MSVRLVLAFLLCMCGTVFGYSQSPSAADLKRERATLAKYEKAHTETHARYMKSPTAGSNKKSYVIATVRLATATMVSPALGSKVKYRRALQLYREALKVDPQNFEAKHNSKLIEDIYRSLGRPIPK